MFLLAAITLLISATFYSVPYIPRVPTVQASPDNVTYFNCTFADEDSPDKDYYDSWPGSEPVEYAPLETGWKYNWINVLRGNLPYGGHMWLMPDPDDGARGCLKMILDKAGTRPLPKNQHTKLYEIQSRINNKPYWNKEPYTTKKEAYYNLKMWFPSDFEVVLNEWRQIWQICGEESAYGVLDYNPHMQLVFSHGSTANALYFKVDDFYIAGSSANKAYKLIDTASIPTGQWNDITIYIKSGTSYQSTDGTVTIWLNDNVLFNRVDIQTCSYSGDPFVT